MQYLAKVQRTALLGGGELVLLAVHRSEATWERLTTDQVMTTSGPLTFPEGHLVLVEVNGENHISTVDDATPWVLDVVDQYLSYGVTPAALEQEMERAEQWRQSLTLKSQDVDRRALETAARRDEIQELERHLKQEREELEQRWEALKRKEG